MDLKATRQTYALLAKAAHICVEHGITYAVLCPGSRSAPIALSFLRNKNIKSYVLPDERSAAYTALGMAKSLQKPVVLICTSGTAALNFAPAIAEAYFSEIPLLILTADRPPEWLGQADNQAIFQQNIYGNNVKKSYNFPVDLEHKDAQWFALRQINEAINFAEQQPCGPVHINIPLREPLYLVENSPEEKIDIPHQITKLLPVKAFLEKVEYAEFCNFKKIVFIAGMLPPSQHLKPLFNELVNSKNMVLLPDITSNLHDVENALLFSDLLLDITEDDFLGRISPDLIVSFGGPIVSKTLKTFLRKSNATHWHLGFSPSVADTFQQLNKIMHLEPEAFFEGLAYAENAVFAPDYLDLWKSAENKIKEKAKESIKNLPFTEIKVAFEILSHLPENSILHLGNSLPIRYAASFPFLPKGIEIFSNRGTSGIDGCVSTAVGQSLIQKDKIHTLILGDLSFLYDSNGLWNNYLESNLKIIVFNNHGGGIFRNLPGSASQTELEEYFVVKQNLKMEHTALQYNCKYIYCNEEKCFQQSVEMLYSEKEKPAVLELEFNNLLKISEVKNSLR